MTKTLPLQTHVHFSLASQENRKGTPTSSEKFEDLKKKKIQAVSTFLCQNTLSLTGTRAALSLA